MFIENQTVVRIGLEQIISEFADARIAVNCQPESMAEQVLTNTSRFDLLILGETSEQTSGWVQYIRKEHPSLIILIFADTMHYHEAMDCLIAGAEGFILQNAQPEEIVKAIGDVISKHHYLCRELLEIMAQEALDENIHKYKQNKLYSRFSIAGKAAPKLSRRQKQIATLLMQGKSMAYAAHELGISLSTIASHKSALFTKLGIKSVAELIEKFHPDLFASRG